MKKTFFFLLGAVFCISLSAQSYTSKNFRDLTEKAYRYDCGATNDVNSNYVPQHRSSDFIPQSKSASNEIGTTCYLSATNANARNVIDWSPDGKTCAATWTMGGLNVNPRSRGTGINYFDATTETWGEGPEITDVIETFTVPGAVRPGWGTHVFTAEGECVISHYTATGGMCINTRDKAGEGEWEQSILIGPEQTKPGSSVKLTEILWPTLYAVGNTIHMVCVTSNTEGYTYNGIGTCPLYYRSTDGGKTWEDLRTFDGLLTAEEQDDISADNYVFTGRGDHLVLMIAKGGIFYLESIDGGNNWTRKAVYDLPWSWSSTGVWVGPAMYASTVGATIDDNGKVHLAFSAQLRQRDPDTEAHYYSYYPMYCGMFTWNEGEPVMQKEDFKVVFDYVNENFTELNYDEMPNFMDAPSLLGFEEFHFWIKDVQELKAALGKSFGNAGYISHPRLIAENGKIYLMYSSIVEHPLWYAATKAFYRGVFLTVSHDNGATYDQRKNTSWLSYNPEFFFCDWSNYEGPDTDSTYVGTIDFLARSENGFPTMATTCRNKTLVCTWINPGKVPYPDSQTTVWSEDPVTIYGTTINTWEAGIVLNTDSIWRGIYTPTTQDAVTEVEKLNNLKIYPNPTSNTTVIETGTNNPYTLTVTNIMGQVIYTTKGQQSHINLNVANYPAGVYIVTVRTAKAVASQKLIVK